MYFQKNYLFTFLILIVASSHVTNSKLEKIYKNEHNQNIDYTKLVFDSASSSSAIEQLLENKILQDNKFLLVETHKTKDNSTKFIFIISHEYIITSYPRSNDTKDELDEEFTPHNCLITHVFNDLKSQDHKKFFTREINNNIWICRSNKDDNHDKNIIHCLKITEQNFFKLLASCIDQQSKK